MNPPVTGHIKLAVSIFLAAIIIVFTVQNVQAAEIRFLVWRMNLSLSLLIFGVLAAGITTGWMLASWMTLRRNREKKKAAKAALS